MEQQQITVSQLRSNPTAALRKAGRSPVVITNRSSVAGYMISKELFEKLVKALEDYYDVAAVKSVTQKDLETSLSLEQLAEE